jgi:hypothetical protein
MVKIPVSNPLNQQNNASNHRVPPSFWQAFLQSKRLNPVKLAQDLLNYFTKAN